MLHGSTRIDRKSARSKALTVLSRRPFFTGPYSGVVAYENLQIFRFQHLRNSLGNACFLPLRQRFVTINKYII